MSSRPLRRPLGLVLAVGVASADASVVVLALPDVYTEFGAGVVAVSWVLTAYALVVALVAAALAAWGRDRPPRPLLLGGLVLFALASLACGLAGDLAALVAARSVQGIGAALLLTAAVPVLAAAAGDDGRGRDWWNRAAVAGAAIGPAAGGVLTQALDWRAIFLVQAPVVALAAVAGWRHPALRAATPPTSRPRVERREVAAQLTLVALFAGLVGALFLAVLLAVVVWGRTPLEGAVIVSGLPVGVLLAARARASSSAAVVVVGAVALATGLLALGLLAGDRSWLAAGALAVCGAGFTLAHDAVSTDATPTWRGALVAGAVSTASRHAGLVVGLALVAPLLSGALDVATGEATLNAGATLLDARLDVRDKVSVAWDLRDEIDRTPRGEVPDVDLVFAEAGSDDDPALAAAGGSVAAAITASITRAFRPSFVLSAGLAALAALPVLVVRRRGAPGAPRAGPPPAVVGGGPRPLLLGGVGIVAAVGLLGGQLATGSLDAGTYRPRAACSIGPDEVYGGSGLDGVVQRIALSAIAGAACELGTTRERLVLSLDTDSRFADVPWDGPTAERAIRAGALRAIDDADERDTLPGVVAVALRAVVERAPIEELLQGGSSLVDGLGELGSLLDRLPFG